MLSVHDDLKVIGEATNGLEAVDAVAELQPDVVLMDLRMPQMGGAAEAVWWTTTVVRTSKDKILDLVGFAKIPLIDLQNVMTLIIRFPG